MIASGTSTMLEDVSLIGKLLQLMELLEEVMDETAADESWEAYDKAMSAYQILEALPLSRLG